VMMARFPETSNILMKLKQIFFFQNHRFPTNQGPLSAIKNSWKWVVKFSVTNQLHTITQWNFYSKN
jgi:hypothetical protein